jgi:hypothetical protein
LNRYIVNVPDDVFKTNTRINIKAVGHVQETYSISYELAEAFIALNKEQMIFNASSGGFFEPEDESKMTFTGDCCYCLLKWLNVILTGSFPDMLEFFIHKYIQISLDNIMDEDSVKNDVLSDITNFLESVKFISELSAREYQSDIFELELV